MCFNPNVYQLKTPFSSGACPAGSPAHPSDYDWSALYPDINNNATTADDASGGGGGGTAERRCVEFADIGCGYGGFLVKLGDLFPDRYAVGMEIRVKVSDYVMDRIKALRHMHPQQYRNIACLRTNAMKYLPNFFAKHQLSKLFFLYPDPHFKRSKHKWRIISQPLLTEYSYVLRPGVSLLYFFFLILSSLVRA